MLLLREDHQVKGLDEDTYDDLVRDEWLPALAKTDDARLLYYARLAHGSGEAYRVVSYTWLRDGNAWEKLVRRVDGGDLASLTRKLDGMRHDVTGKFLIPLPWSKVQDFDLDAVPTSPQHHEPTLYMEDTVWPDVGKLEEYVERCGQQYAGDYDESFPDVPPLLEIQAAYRTPYGGRQRREIVLWQKVLRPEGLLDLLRTEIPDEYKKPGRWMIDALSLRDQWRSRLLRTVSWSPLS